MQRVIKEIINKVPGEDKANIRHFVYAYERVKHRVSDNDNDVGYES